MLTPEEITKRFQAHTRKGMKIAQAYILLAREINELLPVSREASLAMTNLEQSFFWAREELERNE